MTGAPKKVLAEEHRVVYAVNKGEKIAREKNYIDLTIGTFFALFKNEFSLIMQIFVNGTITGLTIAVLALAFSVV